MKSIQKFARSPQGKKTISEAERVAKDPATKEKVRGVRDRFAARRGWTRRRGAAGGRRAAPAVTAPARARRQCRRRDL